MSWDSDFDHHELDRDRRELGIKNSFATRDEIDARQLFELLAIIDQWQDNTKPARAILYDVTKIFCHYPPGPLSIYDTHLKFKERRDEASSRASYRKSILGNYKFFEEKDCSETEQQMLKDIERIRKAHQYQAEGEAKLRPQAIDYKAQEHAVLEVFKRDYPILYNKFLEGVTLSFDFLRGAIDLAQHSDNLDGHEKFFAVQYLKARQKECDEKNAPISEALKAYRINIEPLLTLRLPVIVKNSGLDLQKRIKARPDFAKPLTSRSEIFGRPNFCKLMATCIKTYEEAVASGDVYAQNVAQVTMLIARANRSTIERQFNNIDKAVEDKIVRDRQYSRKVEREVDRVIQQVMLRRDRYAPLANHRICLIKQKIESGDLDSWQAANAMIETLVRADVQADTGMIPDQGKSLIQVLREAIDATKPKSEALASDPEKTFEAFKPEQEDDIKAELAKHWREWRWKEFLLEFGDQFDAWARQQDNRDFINKSDKYYDAFVKAKFNSDSFAAYQKAEFENIKTAENGAIGLGYTGAALCDALTISPDGTALICPEADWEMDSPYGHWADQINGRRIARITTYSLSFKAKSAADVDALKHRVKQALHFVGHTPYRYDLTEMKGAYYRPQAHASSNGILRHLPQDHFRYEERENTTYVSFEVDELWVKLSLRLDLDDVFKLYYVCEPFMEANAQIAAAMNAARYAEERGAVLAPDPVAFDRTQSHELADPIGVLSENVHETLPRAMRDVIIDLSLRKLDDANLAARLAVLSQHTLTGAIRDPLGRFPSFQELLGRSQPEQGAKNAVTLSYQDAFDERVYALVSTMTGVPVEEARRSLSLAFKKAASVVGPMIRDMFRDKARMDGDVLVEALRAEEKRMCEEMKKGFMSKLDTTMEGLTEDEKNEATYQAQLECEKRHQYLLYMTDVLAGRTPEFLLSDEETEALKEANKTRLVPLSNIVEGSLSAIETAIDAVHHEYGWVHPDADPQDVEVGARYYITRTKGSPLVRKDLPKALQPFVSKQQAAHTSSISRIAKALSGPRP